MSSLRMHYYELTPDFEGLCCAQKGRELALGNVYLPSIHVVDNRPEVHKGDILQENDGLLVRLLTKKILELILKKPNNY